MENISLIFLSSEASIRVVWGVAHDGVRAASANLSGRPGGSRVIVLSSSESAAVKAACEKSRRGTAIAVGTAQSMTELQCSDRLVCRSNPIAS
jgi:hypothetical protein